MNPNYFWIKNTLWILSVLFANALPTLRWTLDAKMELNVLPHIP